MHSLTSDAHCGANLLTQPLCGTLSSRLAAAGHHHFVAAPAGWEWQAPARARGMGELQAGRKSIHSGVHPTACTRGQPTPPTRRLRRCSRLSQSALEELSGQSLADAAAAASDDDPEGPGRQAPHVAHRRVVGRGSQAAQGTAGQDGQPGGGHARYAWRREGDGTGTGGSTENICWVIRAPLTIKRAADGRIGKKLRVEGGQAGGQQQACCTLPHLTAPATLPAARRSQPPSQRGGEGPPAGWQCAHLSS